VSDLVVVAFDDATTAARVREKLEQMDKDYLVGLEDLVTVVRTSDGKVRMKQSVSLVGGGALSGTLWGFIFGLIFLVPLAGAAIGAGLGALMGKLTDIGIDDKFIKSVGHTIEPGSSAVFMLIKDVPPDKFLREMSDYRGTIIQTSLSEEDEAKLRSAFEEE
jgi:uncharacterized membrane protein